LATGNFHSHIPVEEIINKAIRTAPVHKNKIDEYAADIYAKGRINIRKSNVLINYIPFMFKLKKGVREYLTESYSELHYTSPGIFDRKIKAYHGTIDKIKNFNESMLDYFNMDIYSCSVLNTKLISPISSNATQYYKYRLDSIRQDENERFLYYVSFMPKLNSFQLIEGHMVICDDTWIIRELKFSGRSEYLNFTNIVQMGDDHHEYANLLPVRFDSKISFHLLGNVIDEYFTIDMDYKSIKPSKKDTVKNRKSKYDLTQSFTLKNDASANLRTDSDYFATLRPVPLSKDEKRIYEKYYNAKEGFDTNEYKNKKSVFWWNVGDIFISSHSINSPQQKVRFSPLISPFLISYSGSDGFSYKQNIRYQWIFGRNKYFNLSPMIGYNFNYRELYWRIPVEIEYVPAKRGSFRLDIGNGNRIYSSDIMNKLKQIPDNIINFDSISIEYFRNFHVELTHSMEFFNGFTVDAGISVHRRSAIDKPDIKKMEDPAGGDNIDYEDIIKNTYISFAPRLKITWTPRLYYYKVENKKINLSSKWPTFSFDYERGIKGIFGSSGNYERLEFDMQQTISLGLLHNIYYRAGAGTFTEQKQMYFVDFRNFAKKNLPSGWNDDIGGTFQSLDRRWYNASREYMRANLTYEAPFIIIPHVFKRVPNVLNERLYFGILTMSHLNPYIELGYGVGTHIFDFGVFIGNKNGKFHNAGVKLMIALFNR
jgi:hypothetical protein